MLEKHVRAHPSAAIPIPRPACTGITFSLLRDIISFPACSTSTQGSHPAQQHLFSGKWERKGKKQDLGIPADERMEREIQVEMRPHVASSHSE